MKNKTAASIYFTAGILSFLYFIVLEIISPSLIISFMHVWVLLALLLVFTAKIVDKRGAAGKYRFMETAGKKLRLVVCTLFAVALLVAAVNLVLIKNPVVNDGSVSTRYVIVLGGGVTKKGTLTRMPQERIKAAAKYLEQHAESKAVVTGGKGLFAKYTEAPVMASCLEGYGIDGERILQEGNAKDTIQNFIYSAALIAEEQGITIEEVLEQPVTVVTSSFHLARAEYLARRLGFKHVYGISARVPAVFVLNVYCREICAYLKLCLRVMLTGKPSPEQMKL